jgi:hypothetical protein
MNFLDNYLMNFLQGKQLVINREDIECPGKGGRTTKAISIVVMYYSDTGFLFFQDIQ